MSQSTWRYVGPRTEPVKAEPADVGCWIDCNQFSAVELDKRIVNEMLTVQKCDMVSATDWDQWREIANHPDRELNSDEIEWLRDIADSAVEWLRENVSIEGYAFVIEDNSLFLEKLEEEELGMTGYYPF